MSHDPLGPHVRALLHTENDPTPWLVWAHEEEDGTITLSLPELGLPDSDVVLCRLPPEPGSVVTLTWKTATGRCDVDCVVLEEAADGAWLVTPRSPHPPDDRRHRMRVAFAEHLSVRVDGSDVHAVGVDLSLSGLRCELLQPVWIAPGTELALEFAIADSYVLARGRVLRCGEGPHGLHEVSVAFDSLTPGFESTICEFADHLARET